jgi:drug/metabolite transporter (DMT)-like permease
VALEIAAGQSMVFDTVTALSLLYVCIFPSLLGYLFLNRGIELIGANRAAPFIPPHARAREKAAPCQHGCRKRTRLF